MLAAQGTDAMVFLNGALLLAALPAHAPLRERRQQRNCMPLIDSGFAPPSRERLWLGLETCVVTECLVGIVAQAKLFLGQDHSQPDGSCLW